MGLSKYRFRLIGSQFDSAAKQRKLFCSSEITSLISTQITIGNLFVDFDYKSDFTNAIYFISPQFLIIHGNNFITIQSSAPLGA
jgi:hypothetical protein